MNYKAPNNTVHFLDDDSFAHLLPAGSVPITNEEADEITASKIIPPTQADLMTATRTQARAMRTPIIGILDGMQSSMLTKGDVSGATVIETAKQGLRDITKTDLSACVTADDMKVAILNQYKAIAADLPANIRAAFAGAVS